jgi:hypothetical protein
MSTRKSAAHLDDGLITGRLDGALHMCPVCHTRQHCIQIYKVTLPENVKPQHSMILYRRGTNPSLASPDFVPHTFIGVTCGCYAKAHRQMAHIVHNRKERKN